MKLKLKQTSLSIVLTAMALLAPSAYAEVTAPVGYVKLTFAAESDTPFSLPMNRPKVFSGKVNSITGNEITLASQDLTASAYVYDAMSQKEKFYVLFTGGALEGRSFDVTTNGTDTITVAQEGTDDLASIIGALATATFEVRPHWTLNTLFPGGVGFPAVNDRFTNGSLIQFKPNNLNGENHSVSESFKYVNGIGWLSTSLPFGDNVNDTVLERYNHFVISNITTSAFDKNIVGDVPTSNVAVKTRYQVTKLDNHVAFNFPKDLTFDDLNLVTFDENGVLTSTGFKLTTNRFSQDGDVLLVYPEVFDGFNPATEKGYYYVTGVGWIDNTKPFDPAIAGSTVLKTMGRAFIIKKAADPTESGTNFNIVTRPYDPFNETP